MMSMSTTLPLAEVRDKLSPLVGSVEATHERVVITKNGRPSAVLIAFDDLQALEETVGILSEPGALEDIRAGRADRDRYSLQDIRSDLEARGRAAT